MSQIDVYSRARNSIKLGFFFMGVPIGILVPRLAEIKQSLGADDGAYGSAIAVGGLGALAGNYLGARLVHRFGSRAVVKTTFAGILLANVSNALVPNVSWLAAVAFASGFTYSMTNIGINSQGVLVEQGIGRSFLPLGHAFWSIGTMSASIISSLIAPFVSPLQALTVANTICFVGFHISTNKLLPPTMDDSPHDDPSQLARHEKIPRTAMKFLLTIAFAQWLALMPEMSVGDWSSVLLSEDFNIPIGPNGYGFAAFMIVQLILRLLSPRLIDTYGLDVVARRCGLIGGSGYLISLATAAYIHSMSSMAALFFSCLAYGFIGLGVATMPAAFITAAGRIPGLPSARALMVTGVVMALLNVVGRIAFSNIAQAISLPLALGFMGIITICAALMTNVLHIDKAERHAIRR